MSDYEDNQFQDDDDQAFEEEYNDQQFDEGDEQEEEEPEGEDIENENFGQQGDEDEEEDEEDQGPDEYEKDDFIVDEDNEGEDNLVAEDDDQDQIEERRRLKKKKRKRDLRLDEDDFDLLMEHGTKVPKHLLEKKKRIQKKTQQGQKRSDVEQLQQTLFGADDFDQFEDQNNQRYQGEDLEDDQQNNQNNQNRYNERDEIDDVEDDFDEDEDEMADFIEDDEDDFNQQANADGEPGQQAPRRQKKKKRMFGGLRNIPYQAMKEAAAICGDVDSVLEEYYSRKQALNADQDLGDEEDMPEELLEQEALGNISREQMKQINKLKKIDPTVIQRQYLTTEDMLIRFQDIPERHLLRYKPFIQFNDSTITEFFKSFDTKGCAAWIYDTLFAQQAYKRIEKNLLEEGLLEVQGSPMDGREAWDYEELEDISPDLDLTYVGFRMIRKKRDPQLINSWYDNEIAQSKLKESIEEVLKHLYDSLHEIPFIACYHKDLCGELLSMFDEDKPDHTTSKELREIRKKHENTPIQTGAVLAHHRHIKRWNILWAIWEYSIKYYQLQQRKSRVRQKLERLYSLVQEENDKLRMFTYMSELDNDIKTTLDLDVFAHRVRILTNAQSLEQQLQGLNLDTNGISNGKSKRPQGNTQKEYLKLQVLQQVYQAEILLSADKFHENVRYNFKKNDSQDPYGQQTLDDMFTQYLREDLGWGNIDLLKQGIKEMAIQDILTDFLVRHELRRLFMEKGVLDTDLINLEDDRLIDAFNPMCIVKRLKNKPLQSFQGSDLILKIYKAQQQKLIKVDVYIPPYDLDQFLNRYQELYSSNGASASSQKANEYRHEIIREAILSKIMPQAQQEAMGILTGLAKEQVLNEMANSLWNYVSHQPFRIYFTEDEGYIRQLRLLVCSWSDGNPPTTFVMLDPQGQPVDFLRCQNLSGNFVKPQVFDLMNQSREITYSAGVIQDVERVKSFVMQHAPHGIIVAASSVESRNLKDGLEILKDYFLSEMPEFLSQKLSEVPNIYVDFENDKIAQIWSDCRQARDEFPEYDIILRKCIGLGRYLLEPIAVISSLCGQQKEISALQLHPLQDLVSKDEKFRIIEQTLITGVCQTGVDINSILQLPWMQHSLQFVGGLGPRKMDRLIQQLKQNQNVLQYRKDLFAQGMLPTFVATNCVGFFRVQQGQFTNNYKLENEEFDALDDTRIHPLAYDLAKKIASSAINKSEMDEDYDEEGVILDAIQEPNLVQEVDIGWYNNELTQNDQNKSMLAQLIDIQMEFIQPYGEIRPDKQLTSEQLFYLLTGESMEVLKMGRLVNCFVYRVTQETAYVSIPDLKIEGTIGLNDVSDSKVNNMSERLRPKMSFQARILGFNFDKFQVQLTCKSSELRNYERWEYRYCKDIIENYHVLDANEREEIRLEIKKKNQQKRPQLKARPINHPMFKNVTLAEAIAYLDKERDGQVIFRPHATSEMQLSFTLKLYRSAAYGAIYLNQNIEEVKKAQGPKAQLAIGRPLKVQVFGQENKEEYDDLDELLARFIEPYVKKIKPVILHPKFQDKNLEDVNSYLESEVRQGGGGTAKWCISPFSSPGYFQIAFATASKSGTIHKYKQLFALTPYGYYFRKQTYGNLNKLVATFKQDPVGPQKEEPKAPPPSQYQAQNLDDWEDPSNNTYNDTTNGYNNAQYSSDYSQQTNYYANPNQNYTQSQVQAQIPPGYGQNAVQYDQLAGDVPPPPPKDIPPPPPTQGAPANTAIHDIDEW